MGEQGGFFAVTPLENPFSEKETRETAPLPLPPYLDVDILAVGHHARLNPAVMTGGDDLEVVLLARLQHRVPHFLGVLGGVAQIDLVPHLSGESGGGHHHVAPSDLFGDAVVVPGFFSKKSCAFV